MKTKILSIATILSVVFLISSKSIAASNNNDVTTTLTDISNISKIEVHGNVQLFISNGVSDKVKVYDSYYNQNALVQEQNGVLRISSYKAEKLVVWVTVSDLRGISAYDNSSVESFGKFSVLDFNLSLNNNASASFDMDCTEAKIALNDDAKANISGIASEGSIVINQSATLNSTQFYAERLTQKRITPAVKAKVMVDELAFN